MLRIIGDVHGNVDRYYQAIHGYFPNDSSEPRKIGNSIQLGDMGFSYGHMEVLASEYPDDRHVFIKGNHDNYGVESQYDLGDYGLSCNGLDHSTFYYVRGGHSIDKIRRTPGFDYWTNEELSPAHMNNCLLEYEAGQYADIVISHEAPKIATQDEDTFYREVLEYWGYDKDWSSDTALLLQKMWEMNKPRLWVFGHHHTFFDKVIDGTRFICLPEFGWCDIYDDDNGVIHVNKFGKA